MDLGLIGSINKGNFVLTNSPKFVWSSCLNSHYYSSEFNGNGTSFGKEVGGGVVVVPANEVVVGDCNAISLSSFSEVDPVSKLCSIQDLLKRGDVESHSISKFGDVGHSLQKSLVVEYRHKYSKGSWGPQELGVSRYF